MSIGTNIIFFDGMKKCGNQTFFIMLHCNLRIFSVKKNRRKVNNINFRIIFIINTANDYFI